MNQSLQMSQHNEFKDFTKRSYTDFKNLENVSMPFEGLVNQIIAKTQNKDKKFFNIMVSYYIGLMAAMIHCTVRSTTRGNVILGNYCIAMAPSGFGKGYSQHILENRVFSGFLEEFVGSTFDKNFEDKVREDATKIAIKKNVDIESVENRIRQDFEKAGPLLPIFDSGTKAAIRQQRMKILLAHAGSLNLVMDEIGSNLSNSLEELSMMLELFDTGMLKDKLVKNTQENQRAMARKGITPATLLLFGTQSKVFDGAKTENDFTDLMQTGYARRSLFAWGSEASKNNENLEKVDIIKKFNQLQQASDDNSWDSIKDRLTEVADIKNLNKVIKLEKHEELILLNYQIACEEEAQKLNEFAELEKIELLHRHSKAVKLAGSIALFEGSNTITENILLSAIRIVEESGEAFHNIINRERTYATLAKYLAAQKEPQTLADLSESLPFFKTGYAARREQIDLAAAWGRSNLITVKKTVVDGIEMYSGESLTRTDLSKLYVSASETVASTFEPLEFSWKKVDKLLTLEANTLNENAEKGIAVNFCTHQFKGHHRNIENILEGFNLIVLDVDGTATLESVKDILKDYHFAICTTKSHTKYEHRFRVIIPLNVVLCFDEQQYKMFMQNVLEFLPFQSDKAAASIAHKWLTNPNGETYVNDNENAKLFDVFPFIPGTHKNDLRKNELKDVRKVIKSHSKVVLWFINKINSEGERNNHLYRLGMLLIESGNSLKDTASTLQEVNNTLDNPLDYSELRQICKSIEPKYKKIKEHREALIASEENDGWNEVAVEEEEMPND